MAPSLFWGSYELDHIVIGNKINLAYRSIISNISEKFNVDVYEIDLGINDFELIKKNPKSLGIFLFYYF